MKSFFPGYYGLDEKEKEELWTNAIVVIDTNVLLDFYRVSKDTSNELISALEAMRDKLWLPYQIAKEYHNNLSGVISEQYSRYDNAMDSIEKIKKQFDDKRNHPFLSDEISVKINEIYDKLIKYFNEQKECLLQTLKEESIKDRLCNLYNSKVGEPYSDNDLKLMYQKGKERFEKKIPPGYMDAKKQEPERYGDFVVWQSLIDYSKEKERPITFVTNDDKEDWFLTIKGKKISARYELINEFERLTSQKIIICSLMSFLEAHKDEFKIGDKTKEEIESIKKFEFDKTNNDGNVTCENNSSIDLDVRQGLESTINGDDTSNSIY